MDICWQLIKRVRWSLCIVSIFFVMTFAIASWENVWLFIDTPRLQAKMKSMVARCDSVVVGTLIPYQPSPTTMSVKVSYYVLRDRQMANLFAEVTQKSKPAHRREYASAYKIIMYMCDKAGKAYCFVSVQPTTDVGTDAQMKSIIEAASFGELLEEWPSSPKGSEVEWVHLRNCAK